MTGPQTANRDRVLYEKSVELRTYSSTLLRKAQTLCRDSRKLRDKNALLATNNPNPNAKRKRKAWLHVLRSSEQPKSKIVANLVIQVSASFGRF